MGEVKSTLPATAPSTTTASTAMLGANQPRTLSSRLTPKAAPTPAPSAPTPYTPIHGANPPSGESTCA